MSTIAPVQSKTFTSAPPSAATQTIAFNAPSTPGNLLTLKTQNVGGGVVGTPTDDKGGLWQKAGSRTTGSWTTDLWYCLNSKGATTITYGTANAGGPGAVLDEWSAGAGYVWALDGTPQINGSASGVTSLTVGPITTTQTNDLLIAVIMQNSGGSITPGAGYTPITNSGWLGAFTVSEYQIVSLPGSYNASATFASATCEGVFAAFSAVATGPTTGLAQPITDGTASTSQNPTNTYGQNVTAGNTLVAIVNYSAVTGNILSVKDSLNNKNWTLIGTVQQQKARTMAFYYLTQTLGGAAPVVTAALDSSQTQTQVVLLELTGYVIPDPGAFATNNASGVTAPTCGPMTTTGNNEFLIGFLGGITVATGPAGWVYHQVTGTNNRAMATLNNAAPGSYSTSWTQASGSFLCIMVGLTPTTPPSTGGGLPPGSSISYGQYMRLLSRQNMILGGPGASTSDTEFSLIARNNKLLGGPMASPAATIMSMLTKQNKLLGGIGARTNDNQFWILVRTLKQLGGTAYPSDNVNTLLRKINTLI